MADFLSINEIAKKYRSEVKNQIAALDFPIKMVGLLAAENQPSLTYAEYTRKACEKVGIQYELIQVSRLKLESEVERANSDPHIHAIMIYYPVFGTQQDTTLKDHVDPKKDVEGLTSFWIEKLYQNDRTADGKPGAKAILPCTALSVTKVIEESPFYNDQAERLPLAGRTVTIFNRSEVVGRPLAAMLGNDGARVYSFDIDGPLLYLDQNHVEETSITRAEALKHSDIVVTGVPSDHFEKVADSEISDNTLCINFSSVRNFDEDIKHKAAAYYSKVGPVTVVMCLRNAVRIVENFYK